MKMRGKRIVALMLAMGMVVTAAAGCSKGENANTNTEGQNKDTVAADNGEGSDAVSDDDDDDEEMAEINVALMSLGPIDTANSDAVQEKINELTEPAINVHVNLQWFDAGTYGTSVPMMIQGGDDLDLMMFTPVPSASYTAF